MSQYPQQPPPYGQYPQPPSPYGGGYPYYPPGAYAMDPHAVLRGPAKKASVMMIVLGIIGLGLAGCLLGMPSIMRWAVNHPEMPAAQKEPLRKQLDEIERSGAKFEDVALEAAIKVGVIPILLLVLAPFVRKGKVGTIWAALILSGISMLGLLLMLVDVVRGGGPQAIGGLCVVLVPGVLFVLLIMWLVQALRNASIMAAYPGGAGQGFPMGPYPGAHPQAGGYQPYGGYPGYGPPIPPPPGGQGPVGHPLPPPPPRQPPRPPGA